MSMRNRPSNLESRSFEQMVWPTGRMNVCRFPSRCSCDSSDRPVVLSGAHRCVGARQPCWASRSLSWVVLMVLSSSFFTHPVWPRTLLYSRSGPNGFVFLWPSRTSGFSISPRRCSACLMAARVASSGGTCCFRPPGAWAIIGSERSGWTVKCFRTWSKCELENASPHDKVGETRVSKGPSYPRNIQSPALKYCGLGKPGLVESLTVTSSSNGGIESRR
mmetsp:Transcript_58993/g.179967  ORF Transcript_58993/g.179967 Transcript_58993/m.179967 type:complete len:219 (-) Transcript_58993:4475-5131(-)